MKALVYEGVKDVKVKNVKDPILNHIKLGEIDPTDIITHRLSLDQGEKAYEIFDEKRMTVLKLF